jgi:hypothetical protein
MIATLALLGLLRGAAAIAAPPVTGSADDLGFGLEKLHWGIGIRQAKSLYPGLDGVPPDPGQPWAAFALNPYSYGGCRFIVKLQFESGLLTHVDLDSNGTAHFKSCNDKVKAALGRQYGADNGGFSTAANPHGFSEYGSWGGPVTEVTYSALAGAFIEVSFARTPPVGQH